MYPLYSQASNSGGINNIASALDGVNSFFKYASKFTPLGLVQQDIPYIANGARAVQTFMNNRVADITNARDYGDSAGMVVGAVVSRPFLRMLQGAVNGAAGLVELGTDPNSRAAAWSEIKSFAEHPIDNTATGVSNYWNNTSWNEKLEDGFVGLYGAGLGGGTKLISRFDTSSVISFESVPSRFNQAGQIGIKLSPNPKLLVNDTVPNFAEIEWSPILTPAQRIMRLDEEGHAAVRHGGINRVTSRQLEDRAVRGIDPASGRIFDAFNRYADGTPKPHKVGRTATAFSTDKDLLHADDFARCSIQFKENVAKARMNKDIWIDNVEIPLRDVFGDNYKDNVRGITRLGSKNNPTGYISTDFTDGTIVGIYKLDKNGNVNLHTLYPNPKR